MIEVVPYDPAWPARFAALRARYEAALTGVPVVAIEHVGSTAVPGLAAKPVIDVDVVVARGDVPAASDALVRMGFEPLGDMGIAERWAFRAPPDLPRTNTYVVVEGSLALRNHLAVRDGLREHEDLRREYQAVKLGLRGQAIDMAAYVAGKSAALQRVLERAGMGPEDRAEIEQANKRPERPSA